MNVSEDVPGEVISDRPFDNLNALGPILRGEESLSGNGDLVLNSPSGIYWAFTTADGNFLVSTSNHKNSPVWSAYPIGTLPGYNDASLVMQGNGLLALYARYNQDPEGSDARCIWAAGIKGGVPEDQYNKTTLTLSDEGTLRVLDYQGVEVWNNNYRNPAFQLNFFDSHIAHNHRYNIPGAIVEQSPPVVGAKAYAVNSTPSVQNCNVSVSNTITETTTWSNAISEKAGVKVTGGVGIPFLADGKVEISGEFSNTDTWGTVNAKATQVTATQNLSVPADTTYWAGITIQPAVIEIEYSFETTCLFSSGDAVPDVNIFGTFKGKTISYVRFNTGMQGSEDEATQRDWDFYYESQQKDTASTAGAD